VWLLGILRPCRQMVPLMSESLERQLSIREWTGLRLHLLVCAWCSRYLKQIKFLRWMLRPRPTALAQLPPALTSEARERIVQSLRSEAPKS